MNKATARYNAANKLVIEAYTKGPGEIDKVLTAEQKAKWKEYTVLKYVQQGYGRAPSSPTSSGTRS